MASNEIKQFADGIDKAITDAVKAGNKDFKDRVEAIKSISELPDIIIQAGGVPRYKLVEGGKSELENAKWKHSRAVEDQIKLVDKKLNELKIKPENAADIVFLTGKLAGWNKQAEKMSIPSSAHTKVYSCSATKQMTDIQTKWEKYCKTDPTILKASLYEKKAKLDCEINDLEKRINDLEAKLPKLKTEYDDRNSNTDKYVNEVRQRVENEVAAISEELEQAQKDVADFEKQGSEIKEKLSSAGLFAFGKKNELKTQLERAEENITGAKRRVSKIEEKKQKAVSSLPGHIRALADRLAQLKNEIERDEKELRSSKEMLSEKLKEMEIIERQL